MPAPPVIQCRVLRWESVSAICEIAGMALLSIGGCAGAQPISYLGALFFATGLYGGWRSRSRRKRYATLAIEHAFLLCGKCAYPLGAIVAATQAERLRCPECGEDQEAAAVEAAWRAEFAVKPSPPRRFLPESVGVQVACYAGILAALVFIGYLVSISF